VKGWLHGKAGQPHVVGVTRTIQRLSTENVNWEEGDHDGLDYAFYDPQEEVAEVEDAVLLADEVDFGEESVQVFVHFVLFGDVAVLFAIQDVGFDHVGHGGLLLRRGLGGWTDKVDVLFENSPHD
jgi:hypothetical protein